MQTNSATRTRPRRRAPLALLTALLALAGATQAVAPASASAMTEQQRQKAFCETVAHILRGTGGGCVIETKSGGGGGDVRYGATEPRRNTIEIVAPLPPKLLAECGTGGNNLVRRQDCQRNPGGWSGTQSFDVERHGRIQPRDRGSRRPGGNHPGPLAKCVTAKYTLEMAKEMRKFLAEVRRQLADRNSLADRELAVELAKKASDTLHWVPDSTWWHGFPPNRPSYPTDRQRVAGLEKVWDRAVAEASRELKLTDCEKVPKAGKP